MAAELERVAKQFGSQGGEDMTSFPEITFKEPELDPINVSVTQ